MPDSSHAVRRADLPAVHPSPGVNHATAELATDVYHWISLTQSSLDRAETVRWSVGYIQRCVSELCGSRGTVRRRAGSVVGWL